MTNANISFLRDNLDKHPSLAVYASHKGTKKWKHESICVCSSLINTCLAKQFLSGDMMKAIKSPLFELDNCKSSTVQRLEFGPPFMARQIVTRKCRLNLNYQNCIIYPLLRLVLEFMWGFKDNKYIILMFVFGLKRSFSISMRLSCFHI